MEMHRWCYRRDGEWFRANLEQTLGRSDKTRFWDGLWCGESALKSIFPRLYQLSSRKDSKVKEMGRWEDGTWTWDLLWRRALRDNEKEWEREIGNRLNGLQPMEEEEDGWRWKGNPRGGYGVKDAYYQIETRRSLNRQGENQFLSAGDFWSFDALLKAKLTAWRLILNRLLRETIYKRETCFVPKKPFVSVVEMRMNRRDTYLWNARRRQRCGQEL